MKKLATRLVAAAAIAALTAGAAHAHRAWILPSQTTVSGIGEFVTIDAAVSNHLFFPDHRPMNVDQITITGPDGAVVKPANAAQGQYRTTFDLKLEKEGTYRIAQASSGPGGGRGGPPPGGMPAAGGAPAGAPPAAPVFLGTSSGPFGAQWTEGKDVKRWRGTLAEFTAQGIDKKKGVELSTSNRRVETFVTVGKPSAVPVTGKGLEISGGTHPNDLYTGEEVSLKFADNGKPAAGVELTLISGGDRYRDNEDAIKVTTDKDGVAKVKFPTAGMYWLQAQANTTATIEGKTVKSQSSYVAVLEVLPG